MSIYSEISHNRQKTYVIFGLFLLLFTGFFYLVGNAYGNANSYAVLGFVIAFASSVGSYFYSDKIVLSTTRARPARKEEFFDLYTVTENLSLAAGIPMPKVYVIDDPSPNAFATGRNPKHAVVCATTGLLQMLGRSELEGVIAHELSHIRNYDILVSTITAVLVGTIALTADWIMRSFWWSSGNKDRNKSPIIFILLIVALILTPIVATLIQLAVSRRREYLADASGALLTRYPDGLANALEKISSYPRGVQSATSSTAHLFFSNPFKKGDRASWLTNLFSTHPPAEKRIEILRSM
ncbi:MAG: Protease HtpX-like protein [Candidatus Roizmanbacteria bacterium GW2011_GWA2_37_7]|uniref:Protease HtpX homolog n=1 Tax=Candidatus Roizmanbacteria bacterium GW2011_GWA2_37_7 TaxID=1618481 RepID=A0A0G0H5K4_9BACT|nr:MAG: Protease HtpX-like protein [Candidatus Roizmanbacteria bacterium GW2011_GWA2_37_7]